MKISFPSSLRARLIVGAIIGIACAVSTAGIFISLLFLQQATARVDSEMRGHLEELASIVGVDAEGNPKLYRALSDPRFSQPGSGLSWQVSRARRSLIKSTSASTEDLPIPSDPLATGEVNKLNLNSRRGPMIVYEQALPLIPGVPRIRLQVDADPIILNSAFKTFNLSLAVSLGFLAAVLILAAVLQVGFGLRPMSRLQRALGRIKSGAAVQLPRSFPAEVQPLVDDLNSMMELNYQMVMRARLQAGNLAHALKTPLAILTDEAYRLQENGETGPSAVILQQCQRMQRQIDYQIARARAAASRSTPGVVTPVASAVANIVNAMRRLYVVKNQRIDVDVDNRCVALCDPMDLNEMLANLIDNACKWGSRVISVRGTVDYSAERAVITVEDDGPGLPSEAYELVFRVGNRLDESIPGSGLGLPIVRDLAELYGGKIRLEPSTMGGLKVLLTLPQVCVKSGIS